MTNRTDQGASIMNKENVPSVTGLRTVGIPVTSQERALDFYGRTLGLEARLDVPLGGGRRWIELAPQAAMTTVALVQAGQTVAPGVETGIRFTTGDADAMRAYLAASGIDVDDVLRWPGVPAMFAFRNRDGNGLEMVEDAGSAR
jgi:lactoylglutathione lyase